MTRVRCNDYMIHFDTENRTLYFEVYPICDGITLDDVKSICYTGKDDEATPIPFQENACVKSFEGSFCWRGVWEGRIYFTDDEYWGEDIERLSDVYNKFIVPYCKDIIKQREPNVIYDD